MFDEDGGGSISTGELAEVLKNMGHKLTDEDLDEMIKEVDEDGKSSQVCQIKSSRVKSCKVESS